MNWFDVHLNSALKKRSVYYRFSLKFKQNTSDAITRSVIWALSSLRDLGVSRVTVAVDYHEIVEALKKPQQWPRYRILLEKIRNLKEEFESLDFDEEKISTNGITRDIAKSVLRDGRFQSYLALGCPSRLHDRITRETIRSDV
ncbi:hypothetical protein F2Q69_00028265 [Brassica cretica]|uniref:RNase H type-1 domain-containing protein n=1 Tax=Brassica cretica TaxID=69181 RepID=A0A8S9S8Y1_BRACR|nr:hypothetical protein F2Q69_00028265 [Brassica cretica]